MRRSKGQSLIELAIALPLLIILFLAIFEWGQIFVQHMRASTISREGAITAHNECIQPVPPETVQGCLDRVCDEMRAAAPGSAVSVKLIDAATDAVIAICSGGSTRYGGGAIRNPALATTSVGEIAFNRTLLTPIGNFPLVAGVMPTQIYKITLV